MKTRVAAIAAIAAAVLLGACGGGSGGGGSITPPPPPAPAPRLGVYSAEQDTAGRFELYLVDLADPGASTKLSDPLVAGGDVANIAATPDGSRVVYRADQDTDAVSELYLVDVASPGDSAKLSDSLVAGGSVTSFEISPDGSHVAYRADQETDGVFELYLVEVDNPGVSVTLSDSLVADGDVSGRFLFSPDGAQVLYAADQELDQLVELYLVDVAAPGAATKLSDAMVAGGTVTPFGFAFTPDGAGVAYVADQDVNGMNELYLVDIAAPGVSQKLNDTLAANGNVEHFEFNPDGTQLVYHADQDTDEVLELYLVDMAAPQVSLKLSDTLVAGGETFSDFVFSTDGTRVAYLADQDTDEVRELYLVEVATPGESTKLNDNLVAGGEVSFNFAFTPDDTQAVYGAEQDTDGVRDLYVVDTATPGVSARLNGPLVAGGTTGSFVFSPDGTQLVYFADQDTDDVFELYLVDTDTPGVATRLNAPLAQDGQGAGNFIFLH